MSILGHRVLRKEDPAFLTRGAHYVDDLPMVDVAHVTYVRSTMAHARIGPVDVDEARQAPGVIAVFTSADVDLPDMEPTVPIINPVMTRPFLARDVVRYVGEPIVAIVTETRPQGADAAELVIVDYDPLPVIVDPEAAEQSEVVLFEQAGTNVAIDLTFGRSEDLFDGCDVVVRHKIRNQRVAPCPLEGRAITAEWTGDRVTVHISTQTVHGTRDNLVRYLGLAEDKVRVIAPDVGGGFGAKIGNYAEDLLVPWLARNVGRPVKWVETRSESMLSLGHGRAQVQEVEVGGRRDGTIDAYRLTILQDAGAYPAVGAALPYMTRVMATGVYAIPKAECNTKAVVTNTNATVAYRGAGRPEAAAAIERAVDLFAAEIDMDPADVRRRNFLRPDQFPYTTPVGTTYDTGDYERALNLALREAGYDDLRKEQARRRGANETKLLGIGLSTYVEVTAGPNPDKEWGAVEVRPDGSAVVRTGVSPHGQGHHTSLAMIASDTLGIPMERIEVVHGDTDVVPTGVGTMGSRSLQLGGSAVRNAAVEVVDKAREFAAALLEADPADIVLDTNGGRFHVAGTPAIAKSWEDVAMHASPDGIGAEVDFQAMSTTFPFGAHVAVVEVDTETGKVTLARMVAVDDAGRILNPLLAEGQIHGGLAQGAAQALLEEFVYDDDGNPVTGNLADYGMISAPELPSFQTAFTETPTPHNPLGAKGIGESGTIGATPAVQNAVVDALSHLGIRHVDMPATPERVWRTIQEAKQ